MINKHEIIGRCGQDPEIRYTAGGTAIASYSVATTEKWKGQDGQMNEDTQWHDVVCFGKLAEITEKYLVKGSLVYVCGKQKKDKWVDNNGNNRVSNKLEAREMKMLSSKSESGSDGHSAPEPEWSSGGSGDKPPF